MLLPSLLIFSPTNAVGEMLDQEFIVKFREPGNNSSHSGARSSALHQLRAQVIRGVELTNTLLIKPEVGASLNLELLKDMVASGAIDYAEPNYRVHIYRSPNDGRFSEQWGLANGDNKTLGPETTVDIDALRGWDTSTGSENVVVGIVDTGIDYNHPDLIDNLWHNLAEIPDNNVDDDANGVIDDYYGFDALGNSGDPVDSNKHGTHVAGIIGAAANGRGIVGVNWHVKLMALKFLDKNGSGTVEGAIQAIDYAVRMKKRGVNIRVLNNSWGGVEYSIALEEAIRKAQDAGILFVAAAGNEANDNDLHPVYPANFRIGNVLSVAAITRDGNLASFSNYGANSVQIAAPGVDILSTVPSSAQANAYRQTTQPKQAEQGKYESLSGTSMAAPFVSGVAALTLAHDLSLSVRALRNRLVQTTKRMATLESLVTTGGIVSAVNSLRNVITSSTADTSPLRYSYTKVPLEQLDWLQEADWGARFMDKDDGYQELVLPFSFPYYRMNFTRFAVSANGRILPLVGDSSLPTERDYGNMLVAGINPYHDDLVPSSLCAAGGDCGVWVRTSPDAALITWKAQNYANRANANLATKVVFQVKLYASGQIEFRYPDTATDTPELDYGASASVGLVAPIGTNGERLEISHNHAHAELFSAKAIRLFLSTRGTKSDFDGDGISDIAVWRPSLGGWFILTSTSGFAYDQHRYYQHGLPGDTPLSGDYDGDGRSDLVVWRPENGIWYLRYSHENFSVIHLLQWGLNGDIPVAGDFDGDGIFDPAVIRKAASRVYVIKSTGGVQRELALAGNPRNVTVLSFGGANFDAVIGDTTGDGIDEVASVWQLSRIWNMSQEVTTFSKERDAMTLVNSLAWGLPGDTPLLCHWQRNQALDSIVVRVESSQLAWYALTSKGSAEMDYWGKLGDIVGCESDFDGDGVGDLRVFRPASGEWFVKFRSDGYNAARSKVVQFGLPGDTPL